MSEYEAVSVMTCSGRSGTSRLWIASRMYSESRTVPGTTIPPSPMILSEMTLSQVAPVRQALGDLPVRLVQLAGQLVQLLLRIGGPAHPAGHPPPGEAPGRVPPHPGPRVAPLGGAAGAHI